jgi:hypothetical protein
MLAVRCDGRRRLGLRLAVATGLAVALVPSVLSASPASAKAKPKTVKAFGPLANGAITHVMVIDLENEGAADTFGSATNEPYLANTLEPIGELVANYFAIGHVSLDNYIAQVSGQAPNLLTDSDCESSAGAQYEDMSPGTLDPDHKTFPGQVDGQGCVMPARVQTIGNQLDAAYPKTKNSNWREYAEDMGNDPARDHGVPDPLGGTDCAHPVQVNGNASETTGLAEGPNASAGQVKSTISDQYADRHDPFIFFHSVIDNPSTCNRDDVPLGTVTVGQNGAADQFKGHLARDLAEASTTPRFSFVTPNLCDDGHDATCAGFNTDGTTAGGFAGDNAWLSHWMPLILKSPAYRSGTMLVVLTFDESDLGDATAGDNEQPGPNNPNPGFSPLLHAGAQEPPTGTLPGGGRVGALLLNPIWIHPGTVDTQGSYNHYSALRTYEDLLGITKGGADGKGHLGFASTAHDFGSDVFRPVPAKVPALLPS